MQFGHHKEDERINHAVVIGVHADEIRIKAPRVREHTDEMREHQKEQKECRDELNHPKRRIFMTKHTIVRTDVSALTIRGGKAAESTESVNHDAKEDEADENDMQPKVLVTVNKSTAREGDQVPKHVLPELDRTREGHVAEKEDAQNKAGDGLCHIGVGREFALTLGVLEAHTPYILCGSGGVRVLDGIRGRHDDWS